MKTSGHVDATNFPRELTALNLFGFPGKSGHAGYHLAIPLRDDFNPCPRAHTLA